MDKEQTRQQLLSVTFDLSLMEENLATLKRRRDYLQGQFDALCTLEPEIEKLKITEPEKTD